MRRIIMDRRRGRSQRGMTLLELILACAILMILSSAALPIARYSIAHKKEELLRYDLRQIRDAIDRYKDLADSNKIRVEVGSEGYPPDLETLVKGVSWGGKNVFDVYSKSQGTASDGTRYSDSRYW